MTETRNYPPSESRWKDKREVVQEVPYPEFWSLELAQKWAREIPENLETEGHKTPLIKLDLTAEGYGVVFIKNEADRSVNPTGTMKDRIGRSLALEYKANAKWALESRENDHNYAERFPKMRIPRYSMLTAGNAGMALARSCDSLSLPPPKLLLDKHTDKKIIEALKNANADIYIVDLSSNPFTGRPSIEDPLDPYEILSLTNNTYGVDLTSSNSEQDYNPHITYYQNLAKQIFTEQPDEIYVPYGSGALFGEILIAQRLNYPSEAELSQTSLKKAKLTQRISTVTILGGEPESLNSIADKLSAPAKPFPTTWERELKFYKTHGETNPNTGVEKLSEEDIISAYELLKSKEQTIGIETEPSACAGLALYMKRWKRGKIKPEAKIIVINTGKGIISDQRGPRQPP